MMKDILYDIGETSSDHKFHRNSLFHRINAEGKCLMQTFLIFKRD